MRYLLLLVLAACLSSCAQDEPLLVYAEPALAKEANLLAGSFSAKTNIPVRVVELSSEVAAQQLKYGQPVDVWIMAAPGIVDQFGISERLGGSLVMGSDNVVKVSCINHEKAASFRSQDCWMKAASGTPLRNYTEAWLDTAASAETDSCFIIANFYPEVQEYLLRGWVRGGYTWKSFAAAHPEQLKVLETGPRLEGVYRMWQVKTGRRPNDAAEFLELSGF